MMYDDGLGNSSKYCAIIFWYITSRVPARCGGGYPVTIFSGKVILCGHTFIRVVTFRLWVNNGMDNGMRIFYEIGVKRCNIR
jgi:hypothetical protein